MHTSKTSKLLTAKEVATRLGLTERAVWGRLYRKQLPFKRLGGRVFVPEAELEEFLAALTGCSAQEAVLAAKEAEWSRRG